MDLRDIFAIVGINSGILIFIFCALYFVLKKALEPKIDALKMKEIEGFKNELSKELISAKHELQLEYEKKSIIYDKQKDSFTKIIKEMQKVERAFEEAYDYHSEILNSIDRDVAENFKEVIINESLFVDKEGEYALNLFHDFLSEAVEPRNDMVRSPSEERIINAHRQVKFLSERIRIYFRALIGLDSASDPMFEISILGACCLINRYHFYDCGFPTKSILNIDKLFDPSQLVDTAFENLEVLRDELKRFISCLRSDDVNKQHFHSALIEAEEYLRILDSRVKKDF